MRTLLRLLLLSVLLCACARGPSVQDVNGQRHYLDELRGKWVFLHYWASWCSSCVTEIPYVNRFARQNPKKVVVLGVNYDGLSEPELKQLVTTLKISFPVLLADPKAHFGIDYVPGLPASYLFNPEGTLVKTFYGPKTEASFNALSVSLNAAK